MSGSDHLVQLKRRKPSPSATAPATGPRVYIETYGCQMNVADTDLIGGLLGEAGYQAADDAGVADVILINTCAVREKAEERVFARARELASHKKRRPVVLAVVGCMAEHLKEGLREAAPHVDVVAGPDSYRRLPAMLERARDGEAVVDVKLDREETYEGLTGHPSAYSSPGGGDPVSAFVTIQRGCDKFCSFCVVPFTRGRERGVAPREVLRHARALADAGYREIVLLGQTVNSYRYEDAGFADLLRAVAAVDGLERVRFTSPYPVDFSPAVIDAIAAEPKICNYVHMPLQSGSDVVLERMRRGYTVDEFRRLVADLRAAVPDIAISTDILSGFCGETEDDHQMTLEMMRELRFDSAFMFSYSERDLTHAAKRLADDVDAATKKRRLAEIIAVQETISTEIFAAEVGRVRRVLLHKPSKRDPGQLVGRTDQFKSVIVDGGDLGPGDLVDVRVDRSTMATLFGSVVS